MSDSVKLVVVGDGTVGKTCMLMCYTSNDFPSDYVPTVFDNYVANVTIDKETISLGLWDTAGQEEFDSLRPLSYPGTDIFLLCFAVIYEPSFHNLKDKWQPEVRQHCPNAALMMVGTKIDLRDNAAEVKKITDQGLQVISPEKGQQMADELKCVKYMECSALTRKGLKEVFETAVKYVLENNAAAPPPEKKDRKKCVLL
ncbi:Rho family GTPase [Entamoeba histolytica HM-1:IMSS-B]|uniref:small monomeric GTPase n=8 Tax=Entamoeba TaxID=5758 RepID=C4M9T7_ENTH1|nr:Rho family GTPase [Entamoeba nuttalli P19]XP_651446.1 Rho family GTPase [Entamoeba histolytica HM-1:IMSS]EMD47528.1 Rho family GTPase, putative [Entamoeba histolytica KU27]EMH73884.1 Rho family GTPase [Entamoeba histolytica HM-1:IMSS-B]EMS15430.1 Rho family GTPase [Entamoeba histolytica HM-3:IMSS]ENY60947.1 Rho family GTPase, putative [Entamoeba histolytica HM-1:IMSS-A]GAT98485.1 Rho family GTPase [Entamoeba histolytica]|eukprot:XP_008857239.1 Rho family GTPase [Entamoeba nuttalli P19]